MAGPVPERRLSTAGSVPPGPVPGPGTSILIRYSLLAGPLAILELPLLVYLPTFYAREMGFELAAIGVVFLLARLWDGASSPIAGMLSDRLNGRFGRRKPWVVAAAPLLMVLTWLLFNPPADAGMTYLAISLGLFYAALSAVHVPYLAWGAELTTEYASRNQVAGFRETGTMLGNLLAAGLPLLVLGQSTDLGAIMTVFALSVVCLIPPAVFALGRVPDPPEPPAGRRFDRRDWFQALGNKPFLRLLGALLLVWIGLGVVNAVGVFLVDVLLALPGRFLTLFLILYVAAIALAAPVVRSASRVGKHRVFCAGVISLGVALLALMGAPSGSFAAAAAVFVGMGLGFCCINVLPTSLLADAVDYDQLRTRGRRAGLYVAIYAIALKSGLAIGVGLAFTLLEFGGFSAAGANDQDALRMLSLVGCAVPGVLFLTAVMMLWSYPLDRRRHDIIRRRLLRSSNLERQGTAAP